jgi:hypothetical protein
LRTRPRSRWAPKCFLESTPDPNPDPDLNQKLLTQPDPNPKKIISDPQMKFNRDKELAVG